MKRTNLRIAIQKDGRLKEQSSALMDSWNLIFPKETNRAMIVPCQNADIEILYVRHGDIPYYVQSGTADFGIVGENILQENTFDIRIIQRLGFGTCRLVIAVPNILPNDILALEGERIATSYPNSLRKFLKVNKINASIVTISGSVEIAPILGLADAVCDLVQTGNTLKENHLQEITTLFQGEAVLIESPFKRKEKSEFLESILRQKSLPPLSQPFSV